MEPSHHKEFDAPVGASLRVLGAYGLRWPMAHSYEPRLRYAALVFEEVAHMCRSLFGELLVPVEWPITTRVPLNRQPLEISTRLEHLGDLHADTQTPKTAGARTAGARMTSATSRAFVEEVCRVGESRAREGARRGERLGTRTRERAAAR